MFEISDFYGYCRKNNVDVIPYFGCPQPAATIRDQGEYAVFLDFSKICSTRLLRGVCYHEMGHVATGALHKVDSPYELAERSEYRANPKRPVSITPKFAKTKNVSRETKAPYTINILDGAVGVKK